ncbi:MATE family efflux transporter [Vibrio alginolyticus]|nr:MATE family efflux transporter [Vibrio alginolyticus]
MNQFERKSLFRLTLPLFLFTFISIGVTFVDTILLSGYSDNLAAAVSLANQILGVAYDVSGLLSVGALILISQHLGRDEVDKAKNIAVIAVQGSLLLGGALAIVLILGAGFFADWVNTPDEIRNDVIAYVYIIAGAMVFNGVITSVTAALRGFGRTVEILIMGLVANAVYIFFEYVLIYGHWGFPEMGVYGAALSTLIVRIASIGFLLYVLHAKLQISVFKKPTDFIERIKGITKISYPSVGEGMSYNVYQLTMVSLIAVLGTTAVLTRSYTLTITSLLSVISFVISQGNEILVGYNKGSQDNESAYKRANRTAVITGVINMFCAYFIYLNGETLVGLFTQDQDVVNGVVSLLFLSIFLTPFNTINLILFNSLKATGDVNRPVLWNLAITFAIALPLGYVMVRHFDMGVEGLWYVYMVEEAIKAMMMFTLWQSKKWRNLRVLES